MNLKTKIQNKTGHKVMNIRMALKEKCGLVVAYSYFDKTIKYAEVILND